MPLRVGDNVFFRLPDHGWVLGIVSERQESAKGEVLLSCRSSDAKRRLEGHTTRKLQEGVDVVAVIGGSNVDDDVDDLVSLSTLHEATILRCLYLRHQRDVVYTKIGDILVVINPFSRTIPWYRDSVTKEYCESGDTVTSKLPHTWATAHRAYHALFLPGQSRQFILVSGESGSGKTEACKIVVQYLSTVSQCSAQISEDDRRRCTDCGQMLQQCSPILEAFGNAKTIRNDNSSRFGKFMNIGFTKGGVLLGSTTEKYLLEKSRIVTAARGERVYHSFYLVLRGAWRAPLGLRAEGDYRSLTSGATLNNSDYDTEADAARVEKALRDVGVGESDLLSLWKVVASVLLLLNVQFIERSGGGIVLQSTSQSVYEQAATLLSVHPGLLLDELSKTVVTVRNEFTSKWHTVQQASDCRDATCKSLYDNLFSWLVKHCNERCRTEVAPELFIGLLDIFGYEAFEVNSFEQLCINLANETLQNHYNAHIFEKDMEECLAEGVDMTDVAYPDNASCLQLIGGQKQSLFAFLDDQCSVGTGSDAGFLGIAVQFFKSHPQFIVERTKPNVFTVQHYAGAVTYDVRGWVEKNRDAVKDGIRVVMRSSKDALIASLLEAPQVELQTTGRKKVYTSTLFRQQLTALMDIIHQSSPHWIRCIKPHPQKAPRLFHGDMVLNQLQSSGVFGTVAIRKAGYPVRIAYTTFVGRYKAVTTRSIKRPPAPDHRALAQYVLQAGNVAQAQHAQLGKTKVFMKAEAAAALERLRTDCLISCATVIQRCGRGLRTRLATNQRRPVVAINRIVHEWKLYVNRSAITRTMFQRQFLAGQQRLATGSAVFFHDFTMQLQRCFAEAQLELSSVQVVFIVILEELARRVLSDELRVFEQYLTQVQHQTVQVEELLSREVLLHKNWQHRRQLQHDLTVRLCQDVAEMEECFRRKLLRTQRAALWIDRAADLKNHLLVERLAHADSQFRLYCGWVSGLRTSDVSAAECATSTSTNAVPSPAGRSQRRYVEQDVMIIADIERFTVSTGSLCLQQDRLRRILIKLWSLQWGETVLRFLVAADEVSARAKIR